MRSLMVKVFLFGLFVSTPWVMLRAITTPHRDAPQNAPSSDLSMRQHYDAAYRLQSAGEIAEADHEHKLFLAEALHHAANGRANIGEYDRAVPLYDEALRLAPADFMLHVDYARAASDAEDSAKAKALAQSALDLYPKLAIPQNASILLILARANMALGDHGKALEQFKTAAAISPDFDVYYALAAAYLSLSDLQNADKIFSEMISRFGDTAEMHFNIGRAYGMSANFVEAIGEFRKVIARDPQMLGAHYSLGASLMSKFGEPSYPEAEGEFLKELALQPNDPLSYPQLGRIALSRHDYKKSEVYLNKALELSPNDADTFILFSELYIKTDRPSDAEAALRKAIAVTTDPSRNKYSIHDAHYQLGRLLIQRGATAEGKKEMQITAQLLSLSRHKDEVTLNGGEAIQLPLQKTRLAAPEEVAEEKSFESRVAPLIAASYNNLGVHAAVAKEYATAADFFEHAQQWNPFLGGVDSNWGNAAFEAREYAQAVDPLTRSLQTHPQDIQVRCTLGISLYMLGNYVGALHTLQAVQTIVHTDAFLETIYADALVKTGNFSEGMDRLQALALAHPEDAMVHRALGESYANGLQDIKAEEELRTSVRLNPADANAQYSLMLTLNAQGKTDEAETMLSKLIDAGSRDARYYYFLSQLQMGRGDAKAAIGILEKATKANPENGTLHLALAEAYHRNGQLVDAQREAKLSQSLLALHPPANISAGFESEPKPNKVIQSNSPQL